MSRRIDYFLRKRGPQDRIFSEKRGPQNRLQYFLRKRGQQEGIFSKKALAAGENISRE